MKNRLLIIGAGELGKQILHYANVEGRFSPVGFVDDTFHTGSSVRECPVLGGIDDIEDLYFNNVFDYLQIGIGYKHLKVREKLFHRFSYRIPFATIIVNPVYIDSSATIGNGCLIYPGCIIDKNVTIGDNCIMNLGCVISHDSEIGSSTFIAPSVTVAGFSKIGKRCMLGINCTVKDNVSIGDDIVIGAGAVVINNISKPGIYYGVPANRRYDR